MKTLSLKFKLISLSVFLMSISILIGTVSYVSMHRVTDDFLEISDIVFPSTSLVLQMSGDLRLMRIEVLQVVSTSSSSAMIKDAEEAFTKAKKNFEELHLKYLAIPHTEGEKAIYDRFYKSANLMIQDLNEIVLMLQKNDSALHQTILDLSFKKLPELAIENEKSLAELREFHVNDTKESEAKAKETGESSIFLIEILGTILGSMGILASIFFSNLLSNSLRKISQTLDDASTHVSTVANQIATSSAELSQATTDQASAVQETAASIEEMNSIVSISYENSKNASSTSLNSKEQAEKGKKVVEEMVQSMKEIELSNAKIMDQINLSTKQMGDIVNVIQEIGTKTKVINDIVFQTKLLSFNASVEAARAGEQGKGFAVVAEEVGNLAQMSGNAAKEIADMLNASVTQVESIAKETKIKVDAMIAEGSERISTGSKVAIECGHVLSEIVANVSEVSGMAVEISNASDEQSKGIQEITKAVSQLDQVTQTNSATTKQMASAAENLSHQAVGLKNQVTNLVSVINGVEKKSEPAKVKKSLTLVKKQNESNVIPIRNIEARKKVTDPVIKNNVVIEPVITEVAKVEVKKVVNLGGAKDSIPSRDHPDFEDV